MGLTAPIEQPDGEVPARLLVVDDERRILDFVARALRGDGHRVELAAGGDEALQRLRGGEYDLVVLDLLMPDVHGLSALRTIVVSYPRLPVLVLSCLDDPEWKVRCLEAGAQDYLTKPFAISELLARVHVQLRLARSAPSDVLVVGRLRLDLLRLAADAGAGPVPLTSQEFRLLRELARATGRPVTKSRLLETVWGLPFDPGSNVVDVCVRRLRRKLGPDVIRTVRGEGYELDAG